MEVVSQQTAKLGRTESVDSAKRPMRIAICPPEFLPFQRVMRGEPEEATYIIQRYISEGLQARGHKLTYLAPRDLGKIVCTNDVEMPIMAHLTWSQSRWFDIASKTSWRLQRVVGIPYMNVFSNYRLLDACMQCLPEHDVVYERNALYRTGVATACKRLGLPYALYVEADDIQEHDIMGKPITGLLRVRARQAMHHNLEAADCVICVSEPLKSHLESTWHVPSDKILVFPNVADTKRFRPDRIARSEVRHRIGIGSDPLVIFVGNFYEWHDVTTLLNGFAKARQIRPEVHLLLVGDGSRRNLMTEQAKNLGLDNSVHFTGIVPHTDVPRLMSAADVGIVPYPHMEKEVWLSPLKLYEYMASGLAIIASGSGQVAEVLQNDRNGVLIPPEDADAMATALLRLLDDEAMRYRLGKQARDDAVAKHSWSRYLSRLETVLTSITNGLPIDRV